MRSAPPVAVRAPASARTVRSLVVKGASTLGAIAIIERGCSFAANLLAARVAGAQVFGAYSLALTTATNVATYAGAGLGTTANRFAGRYQRGSAGYVRLVRSLTMVTVASAGVAILLLLAGASPLARLLLRRPDLTPVLQVAACCAGMMILLECVRGFLIGERRYGPLLVLAVSGSAVVIALPLAAQSGATFMLACQALIAGLAILACLIVMYRTSAAASPLRSNEPAVLPSAAAIWRFGVVQFAGVIGLNAAGWWVTALVARADTTLTQSGLLAVASQLRNLTSLAPNLLTQSSYALLADDSEGETGPCTSVLIHCTFIAALLSVAIGGTIAAGADWILPLGFGSSFSGGTLAVSLALATAIVHMTGASTAARLTIVSLRHTGWINAAWTVATVAAGTWFVPRGGAAAAMAVYLGAHVMSAILVVVALRRSSAMPAGVAGVLFSTIALAMVLAGLALARDAMPAAGAVVSSLMLGVTIAGTAALATHGVARDLLPRRIGVARLKTFFTRRVSGHAA